MSLAAHYARISPRERALVVGGALLVVLTVGHLTLIQPQLAQRSRLLAQIATQQTERTSIQQTMSTPGADVNEGLRSQLAALKAQLTGADRDFAALRNGLVQPREMGALLQTLLTEHRGLQLLGLRSLPVTAISQTAPAAQKAADAAAEAAAKAAAAAASASGTAPIGDDAWLYRHAVEIRVQGSYGDLLAYVQALEALPRKVRWGHLDIDASRSPAIVMTLTLFTVSLEKTWWVL